MSKKGLTCFEILLLLSLPLVASVIFISPILPVIVSSQQAFSKFSDFGLKLETSLIGKENAYQNVSYAEQLEFINIERINFHFRPDGLAYWASRLGDQKTKKNWARPYGTSHISYDQIQAARRIDGANFSISRLIFRDGDWFGAQNDASSAIQQLLDFNRTLDAFDEQLSPYIPRSDGTYIPRNSFDVLSTRMAKMAVEQKIRFSACIIPLIALILCGISFCIWRDKKSLLILPVVWLAVFPLHIVADVMLGASIPALKETIDARAAGYGWTWSSELEYVNLGISIGVHHVLWGVLLLVMGCYNCALLCRRKQSTVVHTNTNIGTGNTHTASTNANGAPLLMTTSDSDLNPPHDHLTPQLSYPPNSWTEMKLSPAPPAPAAAVVAAQRCSFTRQELQKLLQESKYGLDKLMFDAYFKRQLTTDENSDISDDEVLQPPSRTGPIVCASCGQPIGHHTSTSTDPYVFSL